MALTLKADGLNPENLFTANWVNDFTNLLTGVMTDQDVVLDYQPGSVNGKNTLTLKGDGNNPLLKGMKADGITQAFAFDSGGAVTLANTATVDIASIPGATTSYFLTKVQGQSSGRGSVGIRSDGSGNLRLGNNGTSYATELYTDGSRLVVTTGITAGGSLVGNSMAVTGTATGGGYTLARLRAKGAGANAGQNIWIAPSGTDPTTGDGMVDGDIVFNY